MIISFSAIYKYLLIWKNNVLAVSSGQYKDI